MLLNPHAGAEATLLVENSSLREEVWVKQNALDSAFQPCGFQEQWKWF